MKKVVFLFLCSMVSLAFGAGEVLAVEFCVSNAGGLQAALSTAQGNGQDNVIMVVQGTYKGNFTYSTGYGKGITLQGGYAAGCASRVLDPTKTILDGSHAGTVLYLRDGSGGDISVEGFTIQNGNTTGSGGGVHAESSTNSGIGGLITLRWNTFTGNTAGTGGGVYAYSYSNLGWGGTITLTGNTFRENYAHNGGGGLFAYSSSSSGGGGTITVTWNTFTGNIAEQGGGVYASSYGPTGSDLIFFYENTITGNYAYFSGGGVYARSYSNSGTSGLIYVSKNTITRNFAYEQGGGVYTQSSSNSGNGFGTLFFENTVTGNFAYSEGGGLFASSFSNSGTGGDIDLMENTITGNYAYEPGGGVYVESYSSYGWSSSIILRSNTISGNTAYGQYQGGAGVSIYSENNSAAGGIVRLYKNTVANNHMYGYGGGVYCRVNTSTGTTGAVTFEGNTITGNIAHESYGGVFASADSYSSGTIGAIIFANNIVAANSAWSVGGIRAGSYSSSGTTGAITLVNNTITKNSPLGAEVYMSNNTFNCYNNIIWGNTAADISLYGTGTAWGYNNDYHVMGNSWNGGSAGNIDADPLFDAGGYYRLTHTSPCIDKGYNSPPPGLPFEDIDGGNRIVNGTVDIGANEYNGLLIAKEPDNMTVFEGDTFINRYQPDFQWIAVESFQGFAIFFSTSPTDFSTKGVLITKSSVPGTRSNWTPSMATWKKIMTSSYNGGSIRDIYWKVVGTKADKSTAETPSRRFVVSSADPPLILSPANGAMLPEAQIPTFLFYTQDNVKFRLEISPVMGFTDPNKIKAYSYTVTNPNVTPILMKTLSSSQWNAVKSLIGIGGTGYFRIRAWDGLNREADSSIQSFTIQ